MHYFGLIFLAFCLIFTSSTGVEARSHHQSHKSIASEHSKKHHSQGKSHRSKRETRADKNSHRHHVDEDRHSKRHHLAEKSSSRRHRVHEERSSSRYHLDEDRKTKRRLAAEKRARIRELKELYGSKRSYERSYASRRSLRRSHYLSESRYNYRYNRRIARENQRTIDQYNETHRTSWEEHAKAGQLKIYGKASWYGKDFHGGPTASGVKYDMYTFTAAHRTLPMGTVVKVTTQDSGKSVMVCITDRGPYVNGRIIDLSYAAASQLGLRTKGVGDVKLEVVTDSKGTPLKARQAFFVQYQAAKGNLKAGPYKSFSDASAMHEALRQAHPDAKVILDDLR